MKICFGCFEQYDDSFDICPHCGYAEGTEPELAAYMRPGAILNERYVIGRALGHGGFLFQILAQRDAVEIFHHEISRFVCGEAVVDVDDAGLVLECGQALGLVQKFFLAELEVFTLFA